MHKLLWEWVLKHVKLRSLNQQYPLKPEPENLSKLIFMLCQHFSSWTQKNKQFTLSTVTEPSGFYTGSIAFLYFLENEH